MGDFQSRGLLDQDLWKPLAGPQWGGNFFSAVQSKTIRCLGKCQEHLEMGLFWTQVQMLQTQQVLLQMYFLNQKVNLQAN